MEFADTFFPAFLAQGDPAKVTSVNDQTAGLRAAADLAIIGIVDHGFFSPGILLSSGVFIRVIEELRKRKAPGLNG
ncbi:MAG: hypothetical protein JW839_18620 [Candidatus Lokiarchaeota archaeon]|nr:hypothetical protein [Candidatus Lokiarchaeota archaeon]